METYNNLESGGRKHSGLTKNSSFDMGVNNALRSVTQVNFLRGATTSLKVIDALKKPDKIVNHMKGIRTSKE